MTDCGRVDCITYVVFSCGVYGSENLQTVNLLGKECMMAMFLVFLSGMVLGALLILVIGFWLWFRMIRNSFEGFDGEGIRGPSEWEF